MFSKYAAATIVALALAGCAGSSAPLDRVETKAGVTTSALQRGSAIDTAPQRKSTVVKVGMMLPLSGPGQVGLIADTMQKAAAMAHAERTAPHVSVIVKDDKGTAEGAEAAFRDLAAEKVEVILGPLFARSVQAAAPLARQANIPLVAFSNDRQVAGQAVSLLSFLPEPEVQRVVAFAASKGKSRHAALIPADGYGRLVEAAYRAAAARHGVEIVALETYAPDSAPAIAEAVRKLRDTLRGIEEHGDPVSAVFLPGGEDSLSLLTPQLKTAGIDTTRMQVLGTGAMDFPTAGRDGVLVGAWFAAPDPKGWVDFAQRYARLHGHQPPRIAALAYDAMIVATSLSNGPDGARYIPSQLTRPSGFEGIDGTLRLAADGTTERPLAILAVQADGARVIDGAASAAPSRSASPSAPSLDTTPPPARASSGGFLSTIPSAFPATN